MKYKIINTTDRKNLGLVILRGQEKYVLGNGYTFIPAVEKVFDDRILLSNNNYIIEAIKITE